MSVSLEALGHATFLVVRLALTPPLLALQKARERHWFCTDCANNREEEAR